MLKRQQKKGLVLQGRAREFRHLQFVRFLPFMKAVLRQLAAVWIGKRQAAAGLAGKRAAAGLAREMAAVAEEARIPAVEAAKQQLA